MSTTSPGLREGSTAQIAPTLPATFAIAWDSEVFLIELPTSRRSTLMLPLTIASEISATSSTLSKAVRPSSPASGLVLRGPSRSTATAIASKGSSMREM